MMRPMRLEQALGWALLTWLGFCLASGVVCGQPADPGLLGYWRFEEGTGDIAIDSSGQGNHGEIVGAEWVRGPFGTALHFTGENSYVLVPVLEGLDGSPELTVEAWVYWEKGGRYPNIVTGGVWNPGGFMIFVSDQDCSFRMGRPGATAWPMGGGWQEIGAPLVRFQPGRWYHLAATFKQPEIRTYVNGQAVGTARWDYPVGYRGELWIGTWGNPAVCHNGLIDELKIYRRALSAEELAASYAQTAQGRTTMAANGQPPYEKLAQATPQPAVVLENALARLLFDRRGRIIGLVDKATGRNYVSRAVYFLTAKRQGRLLPPMSCSLAKGRLTIGLGSGEARAELGVQNRGRYFVFELLSVSDKAIDEISLGGLATSLTKRRSGIALLTADDQFAVCMRPLNLLLDIRLHGSTFQGVCPRQYGMIGAKLALIACPARQLRTTLQEVVRAEGLPYSRLGGPFAFDAEETRGSYLFATVSETNVDNWIALAKRGGFTTIHLCPWWRTLGHYEPAPNLFPHGLAGLKAVCDKIHAAGLRVGMHTLTGLISVDDPWVTPVPDKRLATDATLTLAEALTPESTTIRTTEPPPPGLATFWHYVSTGNTVRIGDEIIAYTGLSREAPYGFIQCKRGQWGTRPAAHPAGSPVYHLTTSYAAYIPDEQSTLVEELAQRIAEVYNTCGFDQIYMDGAEGMRSWFGVARMRREIYQRLKRPALVEASEWGAQSWPFHSRIGAYDHPVWAFEWFTDEHAKHLQESRESTLLPYQMGWWVITGPGPDHCAMFPEEMEYFCVKCLALDAPMSLEGVVAGANPPNARQDEYLTMLGRYERLRLARYFPTEWRKELLGAGAYFHLEQAPDGTWLLCPRDYLRHKVTSLRNGNASWQITNRFGVQPLRLRLEALYSCASYDAPEAKTIADWTQPEEFSVRASASGVTQALTSETDPVHGRVACLTARNTTKERSSAWAQIGRVFTPYLNLHEYGALGVWIYGDGKGEILNFQLTNYPETHKAYEDHYVEVNFTGWRYFELLMRERDADRYGEYRWPYYDLYAIARTSLERQHIGALNIYLNNLPAEEDVRCLIGPIKALPEKKIKLANPELRVGAQRIRFPVALESGQYLELEEPNEGRLYDERGALLQYIRPEGGPVQLAAGPNEIVFSSEGPSEYSLRAKITIITQGPPLARPTAAKETIDWRLLREEYDPPRTIYALDGRQNEWAIICRRGAEKAQVAAEIIVERTAQPPEGAPAAAARTIEPCEDLSRFADRPENRFAQYVWDAEHKGVADKPGVTHRLERATDIVKVGSASARFTATSRRADGNGWCAQGAHYDPPLDLSPYSALGFWLYGDGQGEFFKLQLRDRRGMWQDMITKIDFLGWRYVEFPLGAETAEQAALNLAEIEYIIFYFNGLPPGKTVTCYIDEIRALPLPPAVREPQLQIGPYRLMFPVQLLPSERLYYPGGAEAFVYRKDGSLRQRVRIVGKPPLLAPGRYPVRLAISSQSAPEFRLRVALTKLYGKR